MLCIYLYTVYAQEFHCCTIISSVRYVPVIMDEQEQWRLVCMYSEGVSITIVAKAMSGHFGRDKTVSLLTPKV